MGTVFFELVDDPLGGFAAAVSDAGYTLRFQWLLDLSASLTRPDTMNTIAHELAHVFRFATVGLSDMQDVKTCETETRKLAESWGFPQTPWKPTGAYKPILETEKSRKHYLKSKQRTKG